MRLDLAGLTCAALVVATALTARAASVDPLVTAAASEGVANVIVALRSATPADLSGRQDAVLSAVPNDAMQVYHRFESVAGFSASLTADGLRALAKHPDVAWVAADLPGEGALGMSVPRIRADRVHARFATGRNVTIAVIDSGVEADHPDLVDALVHEECFCRGTCEQGGGIFCRPDCCPDGSARASGPGSAAAGHPHGTHVSGIAVSRGRISGRGTAPEAKLVAIRVLDESNSGLVSDWLAALDWIAVHRPDVRVVNMSLATFRVFGGDCAAQCEMDCLPQNGCDPETVCGVNRMLADVVARLRRRGTLVVAAAGNQSEDSALSVPACVTGVVAVGALTTDDRVAFFSNGGPQIDILAPGVDVVSDGLNGSLSLFCGQVGGQRVCGGTSTAAPHVAGTAALLASARPGASAGQIEAAMIDTGLPVFDPRNGRTTPRLDARAAFAEMTRTLEIDPGGGSGAADCLVAWNFRPPDIVRRSRHPVATCRDGDAVCDADGIVGQCTFGLSLCFNVRDPLLPFCASDEPILRVELRSPSPLAPPGSLERNNANNIASKLPPFPVTARDLCTETIPIVVPRNIQAGTTSIRLSASTASRSDSDQFILRCEAP
jgi:hypothetical protein